jgi:CheY-like chemotaxis protein
LRILLADDNQSNRETTVNLLNRFGHDITAATFGAETVEQWRTGNFDIILMDVQMPVMDGVEATRIIREHEKESGRHVPIIAMTAHAMSGDREKLLEAGFDGYVTKPVDLRQLNAEMKRVTTPGET